MSCRPLKCCCWCTIIAPTTSETMHWAQRGRFQKKQRATVWCGSGTSERNASTSSSRSTAHLMAGDPGADVVGQVLDVGAQLEDVQLALDNGCVGVVAPLGVQIKPCRLRVHGDSVCPVLANRAQRQRSLNVTQVLAHLRTMQVVVSAAQCVQVRANRLYSTYYMANGTCINAPGSKRRSSAASKTCQ